MSRENAARRIRMYNPHLSDARSQPYGYHIARIPVSSARRSPREQGKRLDGASSIEPVNVCLNVAAGVQVGARRLRSSTSTWCTKAIASAELIA
jgi:hypothetical protein